MAKFRYIDDLLQPQEIRCAHPNCSGNGEFRAPISPNMPGEYQMLCLEHIKVFNKKWDFFREKNSDEIEAFQKDAFTGHRPTWKMHPDPRQSAERLQEALNRFTGDTSFTSHVHIAPPINQKQRHALEQLDLSHPIEEQAIKKQYKKLARRYHPDRNAGDKQAEERFKEINSAYRYLIEHYCRTISEA